jgi:hypothetical protein
MQTVLRQNGWLAIARSHNVRQARSSTMNRTLSIFLALAGLACSHTESLDSSRAGSKEARAPYEAYNNAGGPYCGTDARNYQVECEPLDNCTSMENRRCGPSSDLYQAYNNAGGAYCGTDSRNYQVECQRRHTCADIQKSLCRRES